MLHATLLLATPLFGFSLQVDPALLDAPLAFEVAAALPESGERVVGDPAGEATPEDEGPSYGEQMEARQRVASVHKVLGIATFASMGGTLVLGAIQYRNLYGAFDSRGQNPCARGTATFGQGQCSGTPWLHLISGLTTFALYSTTFGLAVAMPDPGGLDEGRGRFARRLRLHKALRWVHLVGMVAQMGLGFVIANGPRFGLDRTNDYRALRGLATAHLAAGVVTFAALGWAGYLMTF